MNVLKSVRCKEWVASKIPLLVVPLLGHMIKNGTTLNNVLLLFQWTIVLMCLYAFGYIINDY